MFFAPFGRILHLIQLDSNVVEYLFLKVRVASAQITEHGTSQELIRDVFLQYVVNPALDVGKFQRMQLVSASLRLCVVAVYCVSNKLEEEVGHRA